MCKCCCCHCGSKESFWRQYADKVQKLIAPALLAEFVEWLSGSGNRVELYEHDYKAAVRKFYQESKLCV